MSHLVRYMDESLLGQNEEYLTRSGIWMRVYLARLGSALQDEEYLPWSGMWKRIYLARLDRVCRMGSISISPGQVYG